MRRDQLTISTPPQCGGCGCTEHQACMDPQTGLGCAWVQLAPFPWCSVCALFRWRQVPYGARVELDFTNMLEDVREGGLAAFWS